MEEESIPKAKRSPLKVALVFSKGSKNPTVKQTRADGKKQRKKIAKTSKNPPVITTNSLSSKLPQPLCSSTPKALPKSISFPSLTAGPSNAVGNIHFNKELRIVLERIEVKDHFSIVKTSKVLKEKKQNNFKHPKQSEALPDIIVPEVGNPEMIIWHNINTQMSHNVAPDVNSSITSIPYDTLEHLGIAIPARFSNKKINKITPDTPPTISPAGSSNNATGRLEMSSNSCEFVQLPSNQFEMGRESIVANVGPNGSLVSSTSQTDPLDTATVSNLSPTANFGSRVAISHYDLNFGLTERLFKSPKTYQIEELSYYSGDIRRLAPYALKLTSRSDCFYLFAAPVCRTHDKFCCLIFGIYENYLVAYGGHFLVEKQQLYDPITKKPIDNVLLTNNDECRQHLLLFNIPNKTLLGTEGYCPQASHQSSYETQLTSIEIYMSSIYQTEIKVMTKSDVVKKMESNMLRDFNKTDSTANISGSHETVTFLREPRMEQTFKGTNLGITTESMKRILKNVASMNTVRAVFSEYGSFQMSCALDPKPQTAHYVAYEGGGCMSFYGTAFILGLLDDRCVVGVLCDDCFFIMATRRVYSRSCGLSVDVRQVGEYQPEILETIHLPLGVPLHYVLTMLEVRQILGNPHRYSKEYTSVTRALGIAGIRPHHSISSSNFVYNSIVDSEEEKRKWLLQLLEYHFTKTFRESLYHFPSSPVNQDNIRLFGEIIAKLGLHYLLRLASSIQPNQQKTATVPVADWSLKDLFSLDIDAFVSHFLPYFGLSFDSIFQCVRIGANGLPTSVCHHRLSAWSIGNHVEECHSFEMYSGRAQKKLTFAPFFLVFQPSLSPPLTHKECDQGLLNWARSSVEHYRGQPYLKVLEMVDESWGNESINRNPDPKPVAAKRKRPLTVDENQRVARPRR